MLNQLNLHTNEELCIFTIDSKSSRKSTMIRCQLNPRIKWQVIVWNTVMIKKRGGGHENRVNKVVLHDFCHIHAAQDWTNKTNFIFTFEFKIGIEFFGLKPKISIISLIWQELLFICSNRVRLTFVKAIKPQNIRK